MSTTMNFFEHQDDARRRTGQLVVLFVVGVVATIAATYLTLVLFWKGSGFLQAMHAVEGTPRVVSWFEPELLLGIGGGVVALVGLGSWHRMRKLAEGGSVVAEGLGGVLVPSDTQAPQARRLLNIVEEMAIASGLPVPRVYVLPEESGINAFAAGLELEGAAIGVTQGALDALDRAELQGVIAHEFSHILNGDMRLNTRLIGVLAGLTLIGVAGRLLLHGSSRGRRSSGWGIVAGFALMAVGGLGLLFGRLIKAAIGRQREFLADASAVQFTRDNTGIGGALRKIAGDSRLRAVDAEETSHLFFGAAMDGLLDTHPPIDERIRRVGVAYQALGRSQPGRSAGPENAINERFAESRWPKAFRRNAQGSMGFASFTGRAGEVALDRAQRQLSELPPLLRVATRSGLDAAALALAMVLDAAARERLESGLRLQAECMAELLAKRPRGDWLPLLELAAPNLRGASEQQRAWLLTEVAKAPAPRDPLDWALRHYLQRQLGGGPEPSPTRLEGQASAVLALLGRAGHPASEEDAREAYAEGMLHLGFAAPTLPEPTYAEADSALAALERQPRAHERVLEACAITALHDALVTTEERDCLRAISLALGAPMPAFA